MPLNTGPTRSLHQSVQKAIAEVKRYRREYGGSLLRFNSVRFMDGISANQSASYTQPYLGRDLDGTAAVDRGVDDAIAILHEEQLDLMLHSIGDRAIKTVLTRLRPPKPSGRAFILGSNLLIWR